MGRMGSSGVVGGWSRWGGDRVINVTNYRFTV